MNPILFYRAGTDDSVAFISVWNTANISTGSSSSTQIKLPFINTGVYACRIDFGDGTIIASCTSYTQIFSGESQAITHTYANAGTYTITITGTCTGFAFNNTQDRLKLLSISTWGILRVPQSNFNGCANLTLSNVSDVLNLTGATTLSSFFQGCTSLTTVNYINKWITTGVTVMTSMFSGASLFNDDISSWDMSNVTLTNFMFNGAKAFNQNINSWILSNVTNAGSMFNTAIAFNQNIGNWNLSQCTTFTNFMLGKTTATFSTANLDNIYNGWIIYELKPAIGTISFGTAKRTTASDNGRLLLSNPNTALIVTSAANNGSGLIRLTTAAHGLVTGNKIYLKGIGIANSTGLWTVTVINTTQIDLQLSIYDIGYISGGTMRTGYGWTITDGGT